MIGNFTEAIRQATGGAPSLSEIIPGKLIRFATSDRRGDEAGWCKLFDDGEGGVFGCWRQGISETWQVNRTRTPGEQTAFLLRVKHAREEAAKIEAEQRGECRKKSVELWEKSRDVEAKHPYLVAKNVKPYGTKQLKELLIVPVKDASGTLHGLQFIFPDGEKKFKTGTAVAGCYHLIGKPNGKILIAEGFATGATLYESTGHAVACAFNAGNLKPVAEALHKEYTDTYLIICADDDHTTEGNPGLTKATEAARAVNGLLAVPTFPDTRGPKDTDFNDLAKLVGAEAVKTCIEAAKKPEDDPRGETLQQTVARLAALAPLEYEQIRKVEAKRLKVDRVSELDKAVASARGQKETEDKSMFPSDEPWHDPVNGRPLVKELAETFKRFSVVPEGSAITAALWSILTYIFDTWGTLPLLGVLSPEKRCGKTTFLTTLAGLCNRVLPVSNISPAAVYRSIEAFKPTLLIDEGDSFLKDNEELRGIINSGHTKGAAFVIRCEGDNHEPVKFTTWCPKAIAMIGAPPDTIRDRSIIVNLRRKLPEERTEPHGEEQAEDFRRLRSMIVRWVEDHDAELRIVKPGRLDTSNDRQADNWRPLLAIAAVAGCEAEARRAAMLSTGEDREELPAKIQLLCDIRDIFHESGVDRLSSAEIVKKLVALEDRPWSEWKHGKPLASATMTRMLRAFGIHSKQMRFANENLKGFECEMFSDAFTRYTPPLQNETTKQDNNINKLSHFRNETSPPDVSLSNQPKYAESLQCFDVSFPTGGADNGHISELEDLDIEAEVIGHAAG